MTAVILRITISGALSKTASPVTRIPNIPTPVASITETTLSVMLNPDKTAKCLFLLLSTNASHTIRNTPDAIKHAVNIFPPSDEICRIPVSAAKKNMKLSAAKTEMNTAATRALTFLRAASRAARCASRSRSAF